MYDIRTLQRRLNDLGFGPLVVDGIRGPRTDAAIVAFKSSVGLRARPFVGPITWAALQPPEDAQPRERGSNGIPWMSYAAGVKGLHEVRDYPRLRAWFDSSVAWIDPREIPWCGAFVATAMRQWDPHIALPKNPLGARNWGKFGEGVNPQFGAILTFWRGSKSGWKGHVGFYWGEDQAAFHVLGGNQSNAVTVTRISKSRFLEARWPIGAPRLDKRVLLTSAGQPLSTNEA